MPSFACDSVRVVLFIGLQLNFHGMGRVQKVL